MAKPAKTVVIHTPIFPYGFHVIPVERADEALEALDVNVEAWYASGCAPRPSVMGYVAVSIPAGPDDVINLMALPAKYCEQTLWHEALHMAWEALAAAAITPTRQEHETLAYLQEWIVDEVKRTFYGRG